MPIDFSKYEGHCPMCHIPVDNRADLCCEPCAEKRRQKLRELEARYPSAVSLGLLGSNYPLMTLLHRPSSSGRRIIRKSDTFS